MNLIERANVDEVEPRDNFVIPAHSSQRIMPLVMGRHGQVSAGHYLASVAGSRMFDAGGTAIDAGIAAGAALGILLLDRVNYAGVAPIILRTAMGEIATIDGLGVWPRATDPARFQDREDDSGGLSRTVTPAAPDAWATALARYGTLTLGEVLEPAWELAEHGAPVSTVVARELAAQEGSLDRLAPTTREAFFPSGKAPRAGDILRRPECARVLKAQMDAEAKARNTGAARDEAIMEARDLFYRGWIAQAMVDFHQAEGGWLEMNDLASYRVDIGTPVHANYHGYEVYACGPWCQGPVLPQALNILEPFDLESMGHNSAEYLHVLIEAMDLAFADREHLYGDPRHVEVPMGGLLSKAYSRERSLEIDSQRAFGSMPDPGNPWRFEPGGADRSVEPVDVERYRLATATDPELVRAIAERISPPTRDTSYVAAVDEQGNMFSATPSDAVIDGPVIPSLGFSCSSRGSQSRADLEHPGAIAPGRRPRLTPNPALVMLDGQPLMAFGCPGGDAQVQGMLQVLLNLVHFEMDPQQAVEQPRVTTWNFPESFAPHVYQPGRVDAENRIPRAVLEELAARGHDVGVTPEAFSMWASSVQIALINPVDGALVGASDPRAEGAALGW